MPRDGAVAKIAGANAPGRVAAEDAPSHLRELETGPRFRGGIYAWRQGLLRGWAVDLDAPARALRVALEAAGEEVGETFTGEHRPDLAATLPDNVAGFALDIARLPDPARAALEAALSQVSPGALVDTPVLSLRLDGEGPHIVLGRHGITVRKALAQCRTAAKAEPAQESPPPPPAAEPPRPEAARGPRFLAGIDGLDGAILKGWAIDLQNPRASVSLQIEAHGEAVYAVATRDHRADIGAVLEGNVAGFSVDLAALPEPARDALAKALERVEANAPIPPRLVALRVEPDGSLIDLGAFGIHAGDVLAALGRAPVGWLSRKAAQTVARTPARPRKDRDTLALHWLLAHLAPDAPEGAPPARRFTDKLLADIERANAVAAPIKRHAAEIAPLFDPFHYLGLLDRPEDALANPLLHYVLAGWRDGVAPAVLFAPDFYRARRGESKGDPLLDFLREGHKAGIDPHPLFDVAFYRQRHLDGDQTINPLLHYLERGGRERLDPSPAFDTRRFLDAFGLGEEIDVPLEAFLVTPRFEDFPLIAAFDVPLYRYQIEIERGERLSEPAIVHYLARGHRDETLLPNILFYPAYYRERNKLEFDGPALLHYLREGEGVGLPCHAAFSPVFYNSQREIEGGAGALQHALAHPGELRSAPRMDAPIDPRLLALVRDLVAEGGVEDFHATIYRDANPDLAEMSDEALEAQYRRSGAIANRIASYTRAMRLAQMRVRDIPLGFVLADYTSFYPDLGGMRDRFVSALFHYGRYGRQEKRLVGKWLFRLDDLDINLPSAETPLRVAKHAERVDVCILIHAFYPELLPELVAFAQNFRDVSFDIFINVVDLAWTPELHQQLRAICPGAFILLSNDSGRDIGGFTRLLAQVDIARYDVFAFIHSKKSPHIGAETGEYWRRALLSAFAGSAETARSCVQMFHDNPQLGMIGSSEWRSQEMGKNVEQYERLLDLLGVRGKNRELDYLSGFMFLIRADVVARLFEVLRKLDFEYGGDKDLDFHMDGQIAHGVERAVPALVRQMGYEIHYR